MGQVLQAAMPVVGAYVPAAHGVANPLTQYVPGTHAASVPNTLPPRHRLPAEHTVPGAVSAEVGHAYPGAQGRQSVTARDRVMLENVPAGHGAGAEEPAGQ